MSTSINHHRGQHTSNYSTILLPLSRSFVFGIALELDHSAHFKVFLKFILKEIHLHGLASMHMANVAQCPIHKDQWPVNQCPCALTKQQKFSKSNCVLRKLNNWLTEYKIQDHPLPLHGWMSGWAMDFHLRTCHKLVGQTLGDNNGHFWFPNRPINREFQLFVRVDGLGSMNWWDETAMTGKWTDVVFTTSLQLHLARDDTLQSADFVSGSCDGWISQG